MKYYLKLKKIDVIVIVGLFLVYSVFLTSVNVVAQQNGARVLGHSSYIEYESFKAIPSGTIYSGDFIHIVGEIQNVEVQNIEIDDITVAFYDENNNLLTEGPRHTSIRPLYILTPNQKSPFEIILLNQEASEKVAYYEISVESTLTTAQPPALEITNQFSYSSSDIFRVIAEVENIGNENVDFVKMLASFYDQQGNVIGADFTYTETDILVPGQTAPFNLNNYGRSSITEQIQDFNLCVTGEITNEEPYREFQISNIKSGISTTGRYEIEGEIENIGETSATFVRIVAMFYDSSDSLIGSGYTFSDPIDLQPGQMGTFKVNIENREHSPLVENYVLQFDCSEVIEIPENPIPPEAFFTFSKSEPTINETITFDASDCSDADGMIVSYFWNFGDGTSELKTSPTITHSFDVEGTFTVMLTVTDDDGLTNSVTHSIVSVIPEFQGLVFFILFVIMTMIITIFRKKIKS